MKNMSHMHVHTNCMRATKSQIQNRDKCHFLYRKYNSKINALLRLPSKVKLKQLPSLAFNKLDSSSVSIFFTFFSKWPLRVLNNFFDKSFVNRIVHKHMGKMEMEVVVGTYEELLLGYRALKVGEVDKSFLYYYKSALACVSYC